MRLSTFSALRRDLEHFSLSPFPLSSFLCYYLFLSLFFPSHLCQAVIPNLQFYFILPYFYRLSLTLETKE